MAPARITQIAVRPKTLDLSRPDAGARFAFELSRGASAAVHLFDEKDERVRVLEAERPGSGPVSVRWDGRDAEGRPVSSGVYRYAIEAMAAPGQRAAYGETPLGGGDEVLAQRFTHDAATRTLDFILPKAAYARIRAGLKGLPHLRTLADWEPLEAGRHQITWDGLDAAGLIQLAKHPDLRFNITAYALPANTVIVTGGAPPVSVAASATPRLGSTCMESGNPARACRDPRFEVSFPGADGRRKDGTAIVDGLVPVRVTLDARDRAPLVNTRFEVMFFIDTVFLFEQEEGASPMTVKIDTRDLPPGPHVLTINVLSFDGRLGVRSVRFYKE